MPEKTSAQRGASNRRRGHDAERALAKWLRSNGFPHAERAVATGWSTAERKRADPGDITGIPGVVVSVKNTERERLTVWQEELSDMLAGQDQPDALGVIVCRRKGHASPGEWWAWVSVVDLSVMFGAEAHYYGPQWFRTTVAELVHLMHYAGYGDPPAEEAS